MVVIVQKVNQVNSRIVNKGKIKRNKKFRKNPKNNVNNKKNKLKKVQCN